MNNPLPSVVLVGGGGHCRSLIDVIEAEGVLKIAGVVDLCNRSAATVLGYPWIGSDDDLPRLVHEHQYFLISAGQLGLPVLRERLFRAVDAAGGRLATSRSPTARISAHATLESGTVVFHHAVVNAGAAVGNNVIVNTAAVVEHDVHVGDHCHISTGARVNGGCVIGERCFVGSGAVLREGIHLGEGTIIGAAAVVVRDTEPFGIYLGIPARRVKECSQPII